MKYLKMMHKNRVMEIQLSDDSAQDPLLAEGSISCCSCCRKTNHISHVVWQKQQCKMDSVTVCRRNLVG